MAPPHWMTDLLAAGRGKFGANSKPNARAGRSHRFGRCVLIAAGPAQPPSSSGVATVCARGAVGGVEVIAGLVVEEEGLGELGSCACRLDALG